MTRRMTTLSAVGFGVFFVASLAIGVRLVALWARTRQLPELWIGMGILGIGPTAMGCMLTAAALVDTAPGLSRALTGVALCAIAVGNTAACVFNWRVFRPESRAARAWVLCTALLFAAAILGEAALTGFASPLRPGRGGHVISYLSTTNLLWGAAESLRYWVLMRRRLRLGLADPIVTNRFLLWGVGIGAAGVGSVISLLSQTVTGHSMAELPWLKLSNSMHGLASAVLMWIAFLPPAAWKRAILARYASR